MAYKKARQLIRGRAHIFYLLLFGNITNRDFTLYTLAQRDKRFRSGHTWYFSNSIKCSLSRAYNLISIVYGPVVK